MNAITNRAFLNAIVTGELVINVEGGEPISKAIFDENGALIPEMTDFASAAIGKLDKKNNDRKGKLTPFQKANEQLKADIVAGLASGETYTAKAIAETFGITPQKASAMARQLVEAGVLFASEVKGDKGKVKGYTLVEGATYTVAEDTEDVESE